MRTTRQPDIVPRFPAWLVLLGVWFVAAFFLLGDLGLWNDDWFFSPIDPETGAMTRWTLTRPTPFAPEETGLGTWRPLMSLTVTTLIGLCWSHLWLAHALAAALHLFVGLALHRLLRAFGAAPGAALAWSCLFLAFPAGFEAWLWLSASAVAASTLAGLAMLLAMRRVITATGVRPLLLLVLCAGVSICFHEQPAAAAGGGIAALAILAPGPARRRAWLGVAGVAGVYAAYIALLLATTPTQGLGGGNGLAHASAWWANTRTIATQAWETIALLHFQGRGVAALRIGAATTLDHWPRMVLALAIVVGAAGGGFVAWRRSRSARLAGEALPREQRPLALPASPLALACVALAALLAACVPLVVIDGAIFRPRMAYPIVLALAMLGAALTPRRLAPRSRAALALATALACGVFALMCVGMQRGSQERSRMDARDAATLRELFGSQSRDAIVLAPMMADSLPFRPRRAGDIGFTNYFIGPWYRSWGGTFWARHALGNRAVTLLPFEFRPPIPGGRQPFSTPWSMESDTTLRHNAEGGGISVAHAALVPVFVTDQGIELVRTLTIHRIAAGDTTVWRFEHGTKDVEIDVP